MDVSHLEFLVEEPSMEGFLRCLLPRLIPEGRTFEIYPFQGKSDLMAKLEPRLRAYVRWLPPDWRVFVIVDRDSEDCQALKERMEIAARRAGLRTPSSRGELGWQLVNRIAVEELEAWYFGDWGAVCRAYPRVRGNVASRQAFRDSDAIAGGTWEAFERVMQQHGYFKGGLPKMEAARAVGVHMDPNQNRSQSFRALVAAIEQAFA